MFYHTVLPLPRVLNVDDYLDYLANRLGLGSTEDARHELERALGRLRTTEAAARPGHPAFGA